MQPGLAGFPYSTQSIGGYPPSTQQFANPLQHIVQSLQSLPYQLQQLQQLQLLQHQQVQQLLQIVPAQLQQIQQTIHLIAQQTPSLQNQQAFGQSGWSPLSQTAGAGYGVPFQPQTFGSFGPSGQVM